MTIHDVGMRAKIVKIRSGAAYEGKIYDQYVFVELVDGSIIDVFDHMMKCKAEMVGGEKKIVILIFLNIISKIDRQIKKVEPSHKKEEEWNASGHVFSGQIVGFDEKRSNAILDFGVGKAFVYLGERAPKDLELGDFIRVYSVRVDLLEINNDGNKPKTAYRTSQ